jgi:broad specificity phosphatase PhoE
VPTTTLVFETHSRSEDNERGIATGWNPGRLSEEGRCLASELGDRRRHDGIAAVFTSDLARAIETATIAFSGSDIPVLHDWRMRECDYGTLNGASAAIVHDDRAAFLDEPYPEGESWREAVARVGGFISEFPVRWRGSRILIIGHVATRWGLEHHLKGTSIEDLINADFAWREGWEYELH